jgi:membrane protease YdiL (CAAX protease family)
MSLALIARITDSFIYPFSGELLSPMIAQMIILIIPLWLALTLAFPQKSPIYMLGSLGCRKISAEHIFLIIFSSLFMITTSLIINLTLGGVYPVSEGFTLLGTFTAGAGEYTTTYPYLVIVYAAVPAFIEEVLFRGFIFKGFSRRGEFVSIAVSTVISALFAFSVAGLPAAIFCGLTYCFIRHITGSLWSCIIVHFVFNIYALFLQTNLAKYFLSAQNTVLLIIIVAVVWLISAIFFLTEGAKIFKQRADKIKEGEATSSLPDFSFKRLGRNLKEILTFRPVMICAIVSGACFVAITVIGFFD